MLEVSIEKTLGNFKLQSSFSIDKGVLGIIGSSGCGKSMTLKCVAGLQVPDQGSIKLNEKELFNSEAQVNIPPRKRNIGYLFQNYALFPHLNVYNNISFGLKHFEKVKRHEKVTAMIDKMQLNSYEKHYPFQLSGGQQQRVALARTLITEPELLLLDEPFSALDSHVKLMLEKELLSIIKKNYHGIVLLVTHNIEEAYRLCDRILVIDNGKSLQIGDKEEIISHPANLSAARITGCKNIFHVEVINEEKDYLLIKSGSLVLRAEKKFHKTQSKMLAGIQSHHMHISPEYIDKPNSYQCEVLNRIDGMFSITMIVDCQGRTLRVEISKEDGIALIDSKERNHWLHIPEEKIFLMPCEQDATA